MAKPPTTEHIRTFEDLLRLDHPAARVVLALSSPRLAIDDIEDGNLLAELVVLVVDDMRINLDCALCAHRCRAKE